MKYSVYLLFFLFLVTGSCFAQPPQELFQQANEAFQQKKYEQAVALYEQVLDAGYRSAELEYNLGNAYYRQEIIGKAILHYERALVLSPNDADIRHNLEVARKQVNSEIEPLPAFFLHRWWENIRNLAGAGVWGIIALVLWWAGFAGLAVWLFGGSRKQKKVGFFGGLVCILISLLPYSLAISREQFETNTSLAIVLEPTATLRSAPDDTSTDLEQLFEGTRVKLQERLGEWWQVKLENGNTGWLKNEVLEQI